MKNNQKKFKRYWIALGYSEADAIVKSKEYHSGHIEYWEKRGFTPEQAKKKIAEQTPNNIEYWLAQEYSNDEAIEYANIYGSYKSYNGKVYQFKHIEYWLAQGYSNDDAIEKINYYLAKNKKQPEYWMKQGYSREEAKQKIKDNNSTCKRYWINRGYSEEEAVHEIKKLSEKFPEYWIAHGYSDADAKEKAAEIAESANVMFPAYWIKRGYSERDAIHKAESEKKRITKVMHKNWDRSYNRFTPEFWIKRGYSDEDARDLAKKLNAENTKNISRETRSMATKKGYRNMSQAKKDKIHNEHSEYMKKLNGSHSPCFKKYWIDRGYSEEEAKKQAYLTRLNGRQESGNLASKIECKFFDDLSRFLNIQILRQKWVTIGDKVYCQDGRYNNFVFEFNGTRFHLDARFYTETDTDPFGRTFSEVREKDQKKIEAYCQKQYNVIVIWEYEYLNNKKKLFDTLKEMISHGDENKKCGSYWSSDCLFHKCGG